LNAPPNIPPLQRPALFRGFSEAEKKQLLQIFKIQQFEAGQWVLQQGQSSQILWVVTDGRCEVLKHYDSHAQDAVVLAELTVDNYFGELSFFSPAPHSASVRAKSAVKLLRLERQAYDGLIKDGVWLAHQLATNVLQGLAERLRYMDAWVAMLATQHDPTTPPAEAQKKQTEWLVFRDKLFNGWNL
jgi:CRP/FNR family cyclic AMP-dependent transcriptional regulator